MVMQNVGGETSYNQLQNVEALPRKNENGEWLPSGQFPIPKAPFIESVVYM